MLAFQAWSGAVDWRVIVPEGVDDVTLHGGAAEYRVQIKAKHDPRGRFTAVEIAHCLSKSAREIAAEELRTGRTRLVILLERPVEKIEATGWHRTLATDGLAVSTLVPLLREMDLGDVLAEDILGASNLVVDGEPLDNCEALIHERTGAIEASARLAAHHLRHLVGELADKNYSAPALAPATIDATGVQAALDATLSLVDPAAIQAAVSSGLCETITFVPTPEPNFYEGVDVRPGHVGAGLVMARPDLMAEIEDGLARLRRALVVGPSGSGKSAATWLVAYSSRHSVRWYKVRRLPPDQVHLLVQLARSLEATADRPVGFVLDDVGRNSGEGWDAIVRETADEPGIVLLGSIREEDLFTIGSLASVAIARPTLGEPLAERIWSGLREDHDLAFAHWREPFESSRGLLLEYTHLLTNGSRLHDTLREQVRRRLAESRDEELAILRGVMPCARLGGAVDALRLRDRLGLSEPAFARALARLVDEHALRVATDGSLAGLHEIRSSSLYDALAMIMPQPFEEEIEELVDVLYHEDFPGVIPQLLQQRSDADQTLIDSLVGRLYRMPLPAIAGVFYGLGLAICHRVAQAWCGIVKDVGLDDQHAGLAFMLALAESQIDAPAFAKIRAAADRIEEVDQEDLRARLIEQAGGLPDVSALSLSDYHELAAALAPLPAVSGGPVLNVWPDGSLADASLDDILGTLATVREFGEEAGERLAELAGGTPYLLERLHTEIAWITRPELRDEGGERIVASNLRYVSSTVQPDPHKMVVDLCGRLLGAAPRADVAASNAIGWDGSPAGFHGYSIAEKRISRRNLPTPVRTAWNRAVLRAIQRRNSESTESARAASLAGAIEELSRMLPEAAEVYCRGSKLPPRSEMMLSLRALLNSFIRTPAIIHAARSALDQGSYSLNDEALDFVQEVTGLARALIGEVDRPILKCTEAAKLARAAESLISTEIWRWVEKPPREALATCAEVLRDIEAVLGDAHAEPTGFRSSCLKASRSSRRNRTLARFACDARDRAASRTSVMERTIREKLAACGMDANVVSRAMRDETAPYWPRVEHAALISVENLLEWLERLETLVALGQDLSREFRVTFVPMCGGMVVGGFAGSVYQTYLPNSDFTYEWADDLPVPMLKERSAAAFAEVIDVMTEISAVFANADRELNAEESAHLEMLVGRISGKLSMLERLRDTDDDEVVGETCQMVRDVLNRLTTELSDVEGQERISSEIARMANGEQTVFATTVAAHRIALLEYDITHSENCQP